MSLEQKNTTQYSPERVQDVDVINETGIQITRREQIKKYVEFPLVKACEKLWDMNIKTVWSSCNPKDFDQGYGVIGLDYDSLSEENKEVAKDVGELEENRLGKILYLKVPLTKEATVQEVQDNSLELVDKFKVQNASWVRGYTQDELITMYLLIRNIDDKVRTEYPIESFVGDEGYLDKSSDPPMLYLSKELYDKTLKK
jgi:hypothetical protein